MLQSLAGALYAADFIRMLAQEPGILAAHYWSWTGNGYFGAVSQSGRRRPVYYMLGVLNEVLRGEVLPSKIAGPMLTTPAVGYVARRGDVGAVTALATRDGTLIRILAINKHPIEPAALHITGLGALSAIYHVMIADSPFAGRDDQPEVKWSDAPIDIEGKQAIRATLPPHSAGFISVELDKRLSTTVADWSASCNGQGFARSGPRNDRGPLLAWLASPHDACMPRSPSSPGCRPTCAATQGSARAQRDRPFDLRLIIVAAQAAANGALAHYKRPQTRNCSTS